MIYTVGRFHKLCSGKMAISISGSDCIKYLSSAVYLV